MQTAFVADKKLGLKSIHSFMHWHEQSLLHPFHVQTPEHNDTHAAFSDHNKPVYAAQQLITS
jgi:hypothetical protein